MMEKPDAARIAALALMNLGGAGRPTAAEFERANRRAAEALPVVFGPKAATLSAIALHMAAKGDIPAALQAAAVLDSEQSDAVKGVHDIAMNAIADAQAKAGDLRGSFATALRIRQPTIRWMPLLKLATSPITP
jgi:hypothetical protein